MVLPLHRFYIDPMDILATERSASPRTSRLTCCSAWSSPSLSRERSVTIPRQTLVFLAVLVALLIAGTLKVDWLGAPVFSSVLPWDFATTVQALLDRWLPVNELKGEEGLSLQGLMLIGLLLAIGAAAWRGLGQVDNGLNRLTYLTLGLIAITLVFAALGVRADGAGLAFTVTGRTLAVALLCASLIPLARRFELWDMQQWLWETWRFIKMIFPLLIAYLMADPELSLQSILITSAIIGKLKAWTYVGLVALFSTAAGLTYGAWVDGTPLTTLALIIGGFIVALSVAVQLIERAQRPALR